MGRLAPARRIGGARGRGAADQPSSTTVRRTDRLLAPSMRVSRAAYPDRHKPLPSRTCEPPTTNSVSREPQLPQRYFICTSGTSPWPAAISAASSASLARRHALLQKVHPVARAGDRARRRQVVRHGRNGAGRGSTAETPASGAWCGHERRTEGQPCNPRPEACRPTENQRVNAALAGSATQRLLRRTWDAPGSAHMSRKWFPSMKAADSLGSRTYAAARPIIKATAKTATGRNRMMCRPTTETPG